MKNSQILILLNEIKEKYHKEMQAAGSHSRYIFANGAYNAIVEIENYFKKETTYGKTRRGEQV